MLGIPPEGKTVYTFIGTGLTNPTQVQAKSTGASLKVEEVVEDGDGDVEQGELYSVDETCLWKPVNCGQF